MVTILGLGRRDHHSLPKSPSPLPLSAPSSTTTSQDQQVCPYQFLPQFDNQTPPSPHYHSIVGESFIYLDWKLIAPNEKLHCYNCTIAGVEDCELHATKTNFSQNKSLFPIWSTAAARPIPYFQIIFATCIPSSQNTPPVPSTFVINWLRNLNIISAPFTK